MSNSIIFAIDGFKHPTDSTAFRVFGFIFWRTHCLSDLCTFWAFHNLTFCVKETYSTSKGAVYGNVLPGLNIKPTGEYRWSRSMHIFDTWEIRKFWHLINHFSLQDMTDIHVHLNLILKLRKFFLKQWFLKQYQVGLDRRQKSSRWHVHTRAIFRIFARSLLIQTLIYLKIICGQVQYLFRFENQTFSKSQITLKYWTIIDLYTLKPCYYTTTCVWGNVLRHKRLLFEETLSLMRILQPNHCLFWATSNKHVTLNLPDINCIHTCFFL